MKSFSRKGAKEDAKVLTAALRPPLRLCVKLILRLN